MFAVAVLFALLLVASAFLIDLARARRPPPRPLPPIARRPLPRPRVGLDPRSM